METDVGDFAGRNHKEDPELLAWERHYEQPMPNGESDKQAVARVRDFFEKEVQPRLDKGETVLVVSHAGIMRAFDFVLGLETEPVSPTHDIWMPKKRVPNATPLVVEYEDGKMTHSYHIDNPKELEAANQNKPAAPKRDKKKGNGPKR
jgi:broad specificity phosphatase PhoE